MKWNNINKMFSTICTRLSVVIVNAIWQRYQEKAGRWLTNIMQARIAG